MELEQLTQFTEEIRVVHSPEYTFSKSIPSSFFAGGVDTVFNNFFSYLLSPYVIDGFTDHNQRRNFRDKLSPGLLKTYENNALRIGRINGVSIGIQILDKTYTDKNDGTFFDRTREVREHIRNSFDSSYDELPIDKKIDAAIALKDKLFGLLNYLEVKADTSIKV